MPHFGGTHGTKSREKEAVLLDETKRCEVLRIQEAEVHGNRINTENLEELKGFEIGNTECNTVPKENPVCGEDLLEIIESWPRLPDVLQAGILSMVRAAKG